MEQNELPNASKAVSRGWSDDMSSEAIIRRLDIVAKLYAAWQQLKKAQLVQEDSAGCTHGSQASSMDVQDPRRENI